MPAEAHFSRDLTEQEESSKESKNIRGNQRRKGGDGKEIDFCLRF